VSNESTIGASFIVNYAKSNGGRLVRLNIWDTAGQERYAALLPMYSRNADVIIFTIDPINRDSVDYIKKIAPAIITDSVLAIHLVVTKMDLQYNEENAREMVATARDYLRSITQVDIRDYYTSSMTCYNVEQPFITNCEDIISKKVENSNTTIIVNNSDDDTRKRCIYC
jgi:small GTP-binding protein